MDVVAWTRKLVVPTLVALLTLTLANPAAASPDLGRHGTTDLIARLQTFWGDFAGWLSDTTLTISGLIERYPEKAATTTTTSGGSGGSTGGSSGGGSAGPSAIVDGLP